MSNDIRTVPINVTDARYARVMARTERAHDGCLLNTAPPTSSGYGQVWDGRRPVLTHRLVWTHHHGPIPAGMTVDHVCHVRACLEITHLRLLTNAANGSDNRQTRTNQPTGAFCSRHPGEPKVLSVGCDVTYCRECRRQDARRRRARRAAARSAAETNLLPSS